MVRKRINPRLRKKTGIHLITMIYSILLVFPFLLGALYGIINSVCGWSWLFQGHDYEYYYTKQIFQNNLSSFIVLVCGAVCIFALVSGFIRVSKAFSVKGQERKAILLPIVLIFFVTVVARMIPILVFKGEIHPYSDFEKAWERANGNMASLTYYSFFPSYINYSLFEKLLSMNTGANYDAVIWFCAFWNGITSVFIFLITNEIFREFKISVLAALLYSFNPSQIIYTFTSTPEHMAIACFSGCVYCLCKWYYAESVWFKFLCILFAGVLGGIGSSIKTFFPVIVIAFFTTVVISKLLDRSKRYDVRTGCTIALSIVLLFTVQYTVVAGITATSEKVFKVELNYSDATPHYFNVGLNRQGEGQIHIGTLSRLYIQDRNNGISLAKAKARATERVVEDWEAHLDEIPAFLVKKTIWAWQDDYIPISYFLIQLGLDPNTNIEILIYNIIEKIGASLSQLWYIISMLLGIVGTITIFIKKQIVYRNMGFLLTNMLILGYFCISIISESQSRYKCLCIPYICIIDAFIIVTLYDLFCRKKTTWF